jgi:drug/metabolite transporter (DMT)-like permease
LALGVCEPVIYFIGEQYGLKYANSAFCGVMIAVIPIVTLLMTAVFLKERPSRPQWLFSLLSIAGVAAITFISGGKGQVQPLGIALLTVAVIAGSAYSVISRGISGDFSTYERSLIMQLMGAVFFTALAFVENRGDLTKLVAPLQDGNFVFAALYLSLGASVAGYLLFNYAVANAPMANVVSLSNLTTVLSVLAGVVLLGEPFSIGAGVALVVILIGIWGVQKASPVRTEQE